MKCYSTVAMAFKTSFVVVCSCQDASEVIWINVLYTEHVTTRQEKVSAKNRLIWRMSVWLDKRHWISLL